MTPGDEDAFAAAVVDLLDDEERRGELGLQARRRAEQVLDWRAQAEVYRSVYDALMAASNGEPRPGTASEGRIDADRTTRAQVAAPPIDVADDDRLRRFAATRSTAGATPEFAFAATDLDGDDPR